MKLLVAPANFRLAITSFSNRWYALVWSGMAIDIKKVELAEGKLNKKKLRLVLAWVELRQEDLLADWKLAQNGELPFKIEPLK